MICTNCGFNLGAVTTSCPNCGLSVRDSQELARPTGQPGGRTWPQASGPVPDTSPLVMPPEPGPALQAPVKPANPDTFYLMLDGQRNGPYTVNQLRAMWQSGRLTSGTYYWQTGMANWQPLANIQVFIDSPPPPQGQLIVNQVNAPVPYPPQYMQTPMSTKSRAGYVILGLFLGCLGIHNFYAGYSGRGAAQLLITLLLGWLGIGLIITFIWALIEIVAVNTDANGLRMS